MTNRKAVLRKYNAKPGVKAKKLEWAKNNRDKISEKERKRRLANPEKVNEIRRKSRYKREYGLTEIPDERCCRMCGDENRPHLHHRDGQNGRNGNELNNDPENLVWLCISCHAKVHSRGDLRILVC